MDIPVSSTLGFIGIVLFGFGLFLILAGLDIFTIQQVSVKKGPKTWVLGIGIVILGAVLLFPEITSNNSIDDNTPTTQNQETEDFQPTEAEQIVEPTSEDFQPTEAQQIVEPTPEVTITPQQVQSQEETNGETTWTPVIFNIPNDGHWTQLTDTSYYVTGDKTDAFAQSEDIIEGDFILKLDVESTFGNYGAGLVIIYGDGQTWSNGCLIFGMNGFWQSIRIDTIYSDSDEIWLDYKERKLTKKKYTMTIEVEGNMANLYADDILVASTIIPAKAKNSGKIGLVKYWESADVSYSNILLFNP